ncbi:MAG: MFS transporter [Pseudomonadota bacterium]
MLVPSAIGNVLEWYDFALYGYLAPVIAQLFFPSDDALTGLIQTYAVFAIGFLARPIGGVIFGHLGDRIGRRAMLSWSIAMMAVPTLLFGFLPTYQDIGVLAPILLIVIRILQGMSSGGEYSGSVTLLVEHAPARRRGLYGSLAVSSAMIGSLLGAGAGWLVSDLFPPETLQAWGWRVPFISGVVVGAFGLWIRYRMADSPVFGDLQKRGAVERRPLAAAFKTQKRAMALCLLLNWGTSAGYFVIFTWFAGYMKDVVGLPLHVALGIGTAGLMTGLLFTAVFGYLSDRLGQRRLLAATMVLTILGVVPLLMLSTEGGVAAVLTAQLGLAILIAGPLGIMPTLFVSLFSSATRCSGFSVSYNAGVAVFGGTAPLIATALIQLTGWSAAPGLYLIAAMAVALAALAFLARAGAGRPEATAAGSQHPD